MGLVSTSNNAPASEARPGGRSKVWSRREQAGEERVQRRKREGRSARLFQGGGGAIIDAPSPDQREQRSLLDARAEQASLLLPVTRLCFFCAPPRLRSKCGQLLYYTSPIMTTFHPHIVYLRTLLVRNRGVFLRICWVASCDMAVAGRTGPNAAGIMPKVHWICR